MIGDTRGALAAINGDFTVSPGRPLHPFAEDGALKELGLQNGARFAIAQDESAAYIDTERVAGSGKNVATKRSFSIAGWNTGAPKGASIAAFTAYGGQAERPPSDACSVRLKPARKMLFGKSGVGVVRDYTVARRRCLAAPMGMRSGTVVLSSKMSGTGAVAIKEMKKRQHIRLKWSFGWKGVMDSVGGMPILVKDGKNVANACSSYFCSRNPRTGIGVTADGRIRRHPTSFPRLLRRPGAPRGAFVVIGAQGRSHAPVHQRGHGAVQAHLPGPGATGLRARHDLPEVRAAGGKHNDLEQVGHTRRHHTFFEMLGNFSFGDYFKRDAIAYAWEFVTSKDYLGIDPDRLRVTVHHTDDEARALWREIAGLPDHRIYGLGDEDNFWQMGDTGPCGPCTEIYVDLEWRAGGSGRERSEIVVSQAEFERLAEDGRFLEIWNLVFMQYDRAADGTLTPLPRPSVDTGAGLERIAAVMQGAGQQLPHGSLPPAARPRGRADRPAVRLRAGGRPQDRRYASYRVLADHARAVSFLLADGIYPGNEGRGYVLRRILRRAVRHAWLLGRREPTLAPLTDVVVREMGEVYPELVARAKYIRETTEAEERRFLETIEGGLRRLEEIFASGATRHPGRGGVQAVRHLRLPDRPDPDHRGRARGQRGRRRLRARPRAAARHALAQPRSRDWRGRVEWPCGARSAH